MHLSADQIKTKYMYQQKVWARWGQDVWLDLARLGTVAEHKGNWLSASQISDYTTKISVTMEKIYSGSKQQLVFIWLGFCSVFFPTVLPDWKIDKSLTWLNISEGRSSLIVIILNSITCAPEKKRKDHLTLFNPFPLETIKSPESNSANAHVRNRKKTHKNLKQTCTYILILAENNCSCSIAVQMMWHSHK